MWLDPDLVEVASAEFLAAARRVSLEDGREDPVALLETYTGHFAPEFEYDEWAISWRSRLEVAFLEYAHRAITQLVQAGEYSDAKYVALRAFEADPEARDMERRLIALYWKLGARSAAEAQYTHYASQERSDGLEPASFHEVQDDLADD